MSARGDIPMSKATETVMLTRAEYEALIERIEDAEDWAAVAAAEAREAALGKEKARADYLPIELVRRLSAGEHPMRVWRAHRGLDGAGHADYRRRSLRGGGCAARSLCVGSEAPRRMKAKRSKARGLTK